MLSVSLLTLMISLSSSFPFDAYAAKCDVGHHCWAQLQRTVANDGNKMVLTATNLSVPSCSTATGNTHFSAVPQWVTFNLSDFVEVGEGTGYLVNTCQGSDIIYSFSIINNVPSWGLTSSTTAGTAYTLTIDDSATDKTWIVKKGTTTLKTVSTNFSTGQGMVGVEQTHNSTTSIPSTHLGDISYYSGGWNFWLNSVTTPQLDSPMWKYVCTFSPYHEMNVGSGSTVAC